MITQRNKDLVYLPIITLLPGLVYLIGFYYEWTYSAYAALAMLLVSFIVYYVIKFDLYNLRRKSISGLQTKFTDQTGWTRVAPRQLHLKLRLRRILTTCRYYWRRWIRRIKRRVRK